MTSRRRSRQFVERAAPASPKEREMKAVVVRYTTRPETADENQRLIEHDDVEHPDSLGAVPAFQAFVAGIDARCEIAPVVMGATVVGGYR
jgi:hypothetical protein